jgi:hypothetical protein
MKDQKYLATWMVGIAAGVAIVLFSIGIYQLLNSKQPACHCHYRTTDDRFRTGYTKANKPCEPQPNGHVKIGDTVYTNITEYRPECP